MLLWSVTLQSVPCGCGSDTNQDPGKYVNRKYVNMLLWSVTLQSVPCGCGGNTNPDPGKYVNRKYVNTWPYALWIIMPAYLSLISHGCQAIFEETFECSHSNRFPKKATSTK
jgi:hypothetical protein